MWATAAVLPALLLSGLTIGCSGNNPTTPSPTPSTTAKPPPRGFTAVAATGKGTLKGKITLAGGRPNFAKENEELLDKMKKQDEAKCVANATPEQLEQQHWRVAADGGLGNVFVWLAPPAGQFFKIEEKDLPADIKKPVILDQPRCAFEPHAFVLFPSYRDPANPKELKETGQTLIIKNSNTTAHNTDLDGGDDNPKSNNAVGAGTSLKPLLLNPSPREVDFKCTIHPWMNAYARVFDHPYAAVTKADGSYEIKDVPAGAEVHVVIWHELGGYDAGGKNGTAMTLKAEVNTKDSEIKKP